MSSFQIRSCTGSKARYFGELAQKPEAQRQGDELDGPAGTPSS